MIVIDAPDPYGERLRLRPASASDEEFLRRLYFSTREDLAASGVDPTQLQMLLAIQHLAQKRSYSEQFPHASHDIVELDGESIGRLMLDAGDDFIRLVDVSLLPSARGRGIGTLLLAWVLGYCSMKQVPCILQVVKSNPAVELYRRLGFRILNDDGARFEMTSAAE